VCEAIKSRKLESDPTQIFGENFHGLGFNVSVEADNEAGAIEFGNFAEFEEGYQSA